MGLLLIGAAVAVALLVAATLRLPSLVSTLLAAYLTLVAQVGAVTWALSPLQAVTRGGLAVAEAALLAGALVAWWLRGRPGLPLRAAEPAVREVLRDPVAALFLAFVAVLLAYELVLALTVPPSNWDSLTYHLSRTAAWVDHGGIYRIPDVATPRLNEFQPLAEQQILFLFVAAGNTALFALPQYLAKLAILVAVYGAARRLGFGARAAACSSFLVAMLGLFVTQTISAQNDLFAASFPVVAACLVLGGSRVEHVLAGVAAGMGVGAKLTTLLVAPALLWLGAARGRTVLVRSLAGAVAGFAAVGMWGFVANAIHTGSLFGAGTPATEAQPPEQQPLNPSAWAAAVDILYQTLDLAAFSDRTIALLAVAGAVVAAVVFALALRRTTVGRALANAAIVALPFFAPALMLAAGSAIAYFSRRAGFPVRGPAGNVGEINRSAPLALFGPVGALLLLAVPVATAVAYLRRKADMRHLALAAAMPIAYVLLAQASYNWYLTRFLLAPAALCAPLFAAVLRTRAAIASYLGVAALAIVLAVANDPIRRIDGRYGAPWQLTQAQAMSLTSEHAVARAVDDLDQLLPESACVGAVLGPDEPSYLLSGRNLQHRVVYLPVGDAVRAAYRRFLTYAVVTTGEYGWAADGFAAEGWQLRSLGGYWVLAVAPNPGDGVCRS